MGFNGVAIMLAVGVAVEGIGAGWSHLLQEPLEVVAERSMTAVLEDLTPALMALPGVVGVGEGRCEGKPCIKILVVEKTEELVARVRQVAGDEPTEIIETGEIRARQPH